MCHTPIKIWMSKRDRSRFLSFYKFVTDFSLFSGKSECDEHLKYFVFSILKVN